MQFHEVSPCESISGGGGGVDDIRVEIALIVITDINMHVYIYFSIFKHNLFHKRHAPAFIHCISFAAKRNVNKRFTGKL